MLLATVTRSAPGSGYVNNSTCPQPAVASYVQQSNTYDAAGNLTKQVTDNGGTTTEYTMGGSGDGDPVQASNSNAEPTCGGSSFTAGTKVLLASGAVAAISSLKVGDKVLATSTRTGKTTPETVTAVLVHHDTDLYDLRVKVGGRTEVIDTTASHLFWDPYPHYGWIPAKHLKPGMHLKTPDGQSAVVVGGSVPAVHDGWMWDLTVPGNNDHDFYVQAGSAPVLVHNDSCSVTDLASQIDSSNLSMTKTVQNHAWDIAGTRNKDAVNFGKLARPYMSGNNMQLIQEIMDGSEPALDSRGAPGVVEWRTPGSMNGSVGTWELNINANTNTIVHFLFKSAG